MAVTSHEPFLPAEKEEALPSGACFHAMHDSVVINFNVCISMLDDWSRDRQVVYWSAEGLRFM